MIHKSGSLERIVEGGNCTGCGLCAAIAGDRIEMGMSNEGFLRPRIAAPLSPEIDSKIARVCPGIMLDQQSSADFIHPLWGPIVEIRKGSATNSDLQYRASSGGALSAILCYLIESGTVDYVVHTRASQTAPLENETTYSHSIEDVVLASGSRYAPSAPLSELEQFLQRPGRFALVGKPCDIAAVRALSAEDTRISEKIPVMLSFFCAGVPSIHGAHAILRKLDVAEGEVVGFRYRGHGWPGRATAILSDGKEASLSYSESWGDILTEFVQPRCKICPDGTGGFADIVCADAWHCDENGYPLLEEEEGCSLIISRNGHGESVVQQAIAKQYLAVQKMALSEMQQMQPGQTRRKQLIFSRLAAMKMLGRHTPTYRGLHLIRSARLGGVVQNMKSFLGMARRILFPKKKSQRSESRPGPGSKDTMRH